MKKLLILLILLAMAGAAGFIFWKRQAKIIEAQIVQTIAAFNTEVKAQAGVIPVEYQSIGISGFPFAITLTMHNPILRLPLSQWAEAAPTVNWVEEHRFDGAVTISADWKVTRYTLRFPQTRQSVSYVNGKPAFARHSTTNWPTECFMTLNLREAMNNLWQPLKMLDLAWDNLALIKSAGCAMQGYQLVAASNPQIVFQKLENLELDASFERAANRQIHSLLTLKLDKFHAFPPSDQYYKALLSALPSLAAKVNNDYIVPHSLALFGEQTVNLQGDYTGDFTAPAWAADATLDIPQFTLQNALFNSQGRGRLSNQPGEPARQVLFDIDVQASFTKKVETLAQRILTHRFYYQPAAIGISGFHVSTAYLPPNQLGAFVADVFPKISELNPTHLIANGTATVIPSTIAGSVFPRHTDLTLHTLKLENSSWKASLTGKGAYAPERLIPTVDTTLAIENGDVFYAQFANKLIQLEKWRQLQRPAPTLLITQDFLNDFKRFIDAVAQGKRESLTAEIKTLGNPNFHLTMQNILPSINGLGINEVMLLYNDLLMRHFGNNATPAASQQQQGYQPATGG